MKDSGSGYIPPEVRIAAFDEFGFVIVEPPITDEDTRFDMIRTVPVPECRLRDWQEIIAGAATALKGIGWDSTVDAFGLIGDQIDKLLSGGGKGGDHAG
jgi:hypothetical protein